MNKSSAGPRRALITGIAGQDGSYLAEQLLTAGYSVAGIVRPPLDVPRPNLTGISDRIELHDTDLTDVMAVERLIEKLRPSEIYNLAAPSVVPASWDAPIETITFMAGSVVCLLDAMLKHCSDARFMHASSSEIFRGVGNSPQTERTAARPVSPYGVGKLAGNGLVNSYRLRHGLHASSAILYNHESPRRPIDFLPSKVVHGVAAIKAGLSNSLTLGALDAERDWGYAGDYVEAMRRIVDHDVPGDYIISTGIKRSVRDLVETAFALVDLDPDKYVHSDSSLARVGDEADLVGDPTYIEEQLGWKATTSFDTMIKLMLDAAIADVKQT